MTKEQFIEAIQFIVDWGINPNDYTQKKFRNFLNSNGDADDNSIQLHDEHRNQLQIVENIEENLDLLLKAERGKYTKEKKTLIHWLSNLTNKIMNYDEFKGLRGYPVTSFIDKYKPYEGYKETIKKEYTKDLDLLLQQAIKEIFSKIARLDMENEFMSAENFCDGDYEEAEHLYLSLPACIVNVVAWDYLEGEDISEILKSVKIKIKGEEVPFVDVRQVKIELED